MGTEIALSDNPLKCLNLSIHSNTDGKPLLEVLELPPKL